MALDRFVKFSEDRHPTREQVDLLLRDFLGEAARAISWERDRFYVTLHGQPSSPFARVAPDVPNPHVGEGDRERWIEVWLGDGGASIDVMTRQMDEYTNAVATRLVRILARFWEGEIEEEDDDGGE